MKPARRTAYAPQNRSDASLGKSRAHARDDPLGRKKARRSAACARGFTAKRRGSQERMHQERSFLIKREGCEREGSSHRGKGFSSEGLSSPSPSPESNHVAVQPAVRRATPPVERFARLRPAPSLLPRSCLAPASLPAPSRRPRALPPGARPPSRRPPGVLLPPCRLPRSLPPSLPRSRGRAAICCCRSTRRSSPVTF